MVKVNKSAYVQFAKEGIVGFVAGAGADAVVEVTKAPHLNDQAPIGGPGLTNFEMYSYGLGMLMTTVGAYSLLTGKNIAFGGIGKELFSTGLGIVLGVNIYEHVIAEKIGIR
jgi:hypothetical protein